MIFFLGTSHAAEHLREAAIAKGLNVGLEMRHAELIFVSEDTPTNEAGERDLTPIRAMVNGALKVGCPVVLTSQVTPGFTRSFDEPTRLYHQAETLRIKDAKERALAPDYIAIGSAFYSSFDLLPRAYLNYLDAFPCRKRLVTYEDAEFSKIAVNMTLAAQVDNTNRLQKAAKKCGVSWWHVADILKLDKRIGDESYLKPGRWQDSRHLLRDYVTLEDILAR